MIINRYLIREICKPLGVIGTILLIIFASYTAARYLADATQGLLPGHTVLLLILLKAAIALEVLLPTTLYLSVVLALGRLHTDSEMIALSASGIGIARVLKAVVCLSLPLVVLAGSLSLYLRPWAYEKIYWLKAQANAEFDINRLEAKNFYKISQGNYVVFPKVIDRQHDRAEQVFVQSESNNTIQVVNAKQVYQRLDETSGRKVVIFFDGYLYEFPRNEKGGQVTKFDKSTFFLRPIDITPVEYKIKATATSKLARSHSPSDIAELQWRLSVPISTMLLALLGVPLSRTAPRQGKYAKLVTAVVVYAIYYNLSGMAKMWVEQGVIGTIPGIWWVHVLLAGLLLALILPSGLPLRR